ncbi:MAG: carboxypeptidase-like regulatory domain-containing protein [Cyclobacteriaceae bacterium]
MKLKFLLFSIALIVLSLDGSAQKLLKGIVVDSTTLNAVPNASVRIKSTKWGTLTDAGGVFFIKVKPTDTLIFSSVGYVRIEIPVTIDDEIMFVRMVQDVILLKEVTILGRPEAAKPQLPSLKLRSSSLPFSGAMPNGQGGAAVNLDYFSKREREKRKLKQLSLELSRTQTYVEIVTNPEVKQELMDRFSISDTTFYKILTHFNESHREVTHSGSQGTILNSLFSFFEAEVRLRRRLHH